MSSTAGLRPGAATGQMERPARKGPFGRKRRPADRVVNASVVVAPAESVDLTISGDALDALVRIARDEGKTLSDVVRDAIALKERAAEARREGGRVLIERRGKLREMVGA